VVVVLPVGQVRFVTPIYHPNVDETGTNICLEIVASDHWKPATKVAQGTASLRALVYP
jgi:GDP-L-fucose synthase/ubiquitin-conjugating enzyme E2 L3